MSDAPKQTMTTEDRRCGTCSSWVRRRNSQDGECCWCPEDAPPWLTNIIAETHELAHAACQQWEPING